MAERHPAPGERRWFLEGPHHPRNATDFKF